MSSRTYLWAEAGQPLRLPNGFWSGKNRYQQFANTRHRYVEVQTDGNRICRIICSHIVFDGDGGWDPTAAADVAGDIMRLHWEKQEPVPQLDVVRKARDTVAEDRWQISDTDLEKIVNDVTGKQRIPFVKST